MVAAFPAEIVLSLKAKGIKQQLSQVEAATQRIQQRADQVAARWEKINKRIPTKEFGEVANKLRAVTKLSERVNSLAERRRQRLKGENSLTNGLLKLRKATLEAARSEAQERGESVAKQRELNRELRKTRQYSKPIGPKQAPGSGGGARRGGGGGLGGLGAGIGFPLLFGGGPGSIIGGAIGSAGGFGTQILASAIGGIIDQAVAGVAKLGQALNPLTADIDAVIAAAGESGTAFEKLVKDLEKVAGKEKALAAATAQLAIVIGQDGVNALEEFGDESAKLGRIFAQTLSQIGAAVANLINNSGALTALAERLERTSLINKAVQDPNQSDNLRDLVQERGRAARGQGERDRSLIDDDIVAEQKKLDLKKESALVEETLADIAKVNERISKVNLATAENELALSRINAGLENDKVFELRLQGIELKRNEEINQNILDLNNKQITRQQAIANQIAINSRAEAARNNLKTDRANAQERLANTAANDAKRLAREAEAAAKAAARLQSSILGEQAKQLDIANQSIALEFGEKVALQDKLKLIDQIYDTKAQQIILTTEEAALESEKLKTLALQKDLEKEQIRLQLQQLEIAERTAAIQGRQSVENTRTGLEQELGGLSLGLSPELELANEQANRLTNTLKGLDDQLEILRSRRTDVPNAQLESQIKTIEGQKAAYQQLLPQIFAAEQQQLRYNQAFAAVTPAVNSLVGGLREVVAGTKTAEQAFADFLNTIADQLINTAATMIAQYIAIGIARKFAGIPAPGAGAFNLSGGGSSVGAAGLPGIDGLGGLFNGSIPFFGSSQPSFLASGGPATSGQPYIVGEKGPELFIPGVTGTVSNNDQFEAAREAMSGGTGDGVSETGGLGSEGVSSAFADNTSSISTTNSYMRERSMETNNQTTIGGAGSMTIETRVINNVEYATVEQVRLASAASAKQAKAQVFSDMKNKPAVRRKAGIN